MPFSFVDLMIPLGLFVLWRIVKRSRRLPYPPGPPGNFLLGNISDLPPEKQWLAFQKFSEDYGSPLVHVQVLGTHIVVVNDHETAFEIFTKRPQLYSDRPRMTMINEVAGYAWTIAFSRTTPQWKTKRRMADQFFREAEVRKLWPQEAISAYKLVNLMLETPKESPSHFRFFTSRVILDVEYGIEVEDSKDPYIQAVDAGLADVNQTPNHNVVEALPWMRHLPHWLPGMSWKRKTLEWKARSHKMKDAPFNAVKAGKVPKPSIAAHMLEVEKKTPEQEQLISEALGNSFGAAVDTTSAVLWGFLLTLVLWPETQRRAQEELDNYLAGQDRLPEISDRPNLPYIHALCKEILRWTCVAPLALPHRASADDVWVNKEGKSFFIPKDAIVMGNAWSMTRDPRHYPNPNVYDPSRFLTPDGKFNTAVKAPDVVFGFRARVCPGRWMAEDTTFACVAAMLYVMNVERTPNSPVWKDNFSELMTSTLIIHPHPFEYDIKPRSERHVALIKHAVAA